MTTWWLQGEVDRGTIEEYVELEKEIASHEAQRWGIVINIIVIVITIISLSLSSLQPRTDPAAEEEPAGPPGGEDQAAGGERRGLGRADVSI